MAFFWQLLKTQRIVNHHMTNFLRMLQLFSLKKLRQAVGLGFIWDILCFYAFQCWKNSNVPDFIHLWLIQNPAQTWGIKYSLSLRMMILDDLSLRSGAASHHDSISPHLRPGPRLQRVRADGDGRDFLPRGTFSHPRDKVISNDVSDTQLQI